MHYHRGCSVSLPCSEWERVGPLRYDHQKAGGAEASPWGKVRGGLYSTSPEILGTDFSFYTDDAFNWSSSKHRPSARLKEQDVL